MHILICGVMGWLIDSNTGVLSSAPITSSESISSPFPPINLKVLWTKIDEGKCCGGGWINILHTIHIIKSNDTVRVTKKSNMWEEG